MSIHYELLVKPDQIAPGSLARELFDISGHFEHCMISHHHMTVKCIFLNTGIACRGSAAGWRVTKIILLIEVRLREVCVVVEAAAF